MQSYVNWGSGPRYSDDVKWLTAPLGGGPMGPEPTPPINPNED